MTFLFATLAFAEVKKVAILPTVDKTNTVPYGVELQLCGSLTHAISNSPGYEGYDRVDMSSIMSEHNFQRTGVVSDSQIKQLGKMTGAAFVLIAEASEYDLENIIIVAKILDVETGGVMASAPPVVANKDPMKMAEACKKICDTLVGSSRQSSSSTTKKSNMPSEEEKVYIAVEKMPEFPGGTSAMSRFISRNIKYPLLAQENGIQGRVVCQFTVNTDGSIVDVSVVKGVEASLDTEAVRVIKSMPKWTPAMQGGKPVRARYTLPMRFKLSVVEE